MDDLNKIEEFNPFSEKSKELIISIGNTEYFELCEISSKIQCLDFSLSGEVGIVDCTCGNHMQPSERNRQMNKDWIRRLVNPQLRYQKESYPWSQTWAIHAAVHVLQST